MKKKPLTEQELYEYCHEYFNYDDGNLIWKKHPKYSKIQVGDIAGCTKSNGYSYVAFERERYALHRLIFLFHNGYLTKIVDHADRNPKNNKIENLRGCTQKENMGNKVKSNANTSGYKGVSYHKTGRKYQARIKQDDKSIYLGLYDTPELAYEAYCKKAKEIFGEFAHL